MPYEVSWGLELVWENLQIENMGIIFAEHEILCNFVTAFYYVLCFLDFISLHCSGYVRLDLMVLLFYTIVH